MAHGRRSQVFAGLDSIFSTLISPCSRKTACIPGSVRMQPTQITVSCKPPGSRFIRSVIMVFQRFRRCLHLSGRNLQGYRGVAASNVERKLGKLVSWDALPLTGIPGRASLPQDLLRSGSLSVRRLCSQFCLICRSFSGRRRKETTQSEHFRAGPL